MTSRDRMAIAVRVLAAVLGGYAVAAQGAVCIAVLLRAPDDEAVLAGMLASFAIYAAAVIWTFAARTASRACLGLLAVELVLGGASLVGRHTMAG